ncbi:MAG: outer membrane protein assembly factor BamB family protein [Actinomycetota bacterium]
MPLHAPRPIPGYLLIADRGNDRMLLVDGQKQILWRYPRPGHPPSMPFHFDDDAFFTPGFRAVISNQEEQQTIQEISFPRGRVIWRYGRVGVAGSGPGELHTPDDAYALADGTVMVADVGNCRILFLGPRGHVQRQLGSTLACGHAPPRLLASPNGDTPMPGGGVLVTEIGGSWIDAIAPDGSLRWSVHAPVSYPSDAQPLGQGKILLADYARPGRVLIMSRDGRVLWSYGPSSGPGMLDHPSLALMLPNGLIAVNDDYRDRVVLIDRARHRIVWQYGHTGVPGRTPGYLHTPDGMDFLPVRAASRISAIRRTVRSAS